MSEPAEAPVSGPAERTLQAAIRDVRNAAADRSDVVVELREAQRTRLELLAEALQPVFLEVPADLDWFDFALSSGTRPRLWIDAVSHVCLGRDRRTYRFVRDTRLGRTVLAESHDIKPIADQVTRYIAERIVERQRMIDGDVQPLLDRALEDAEMMQTGSVQEADDMDAVPDREMARHPATVALVYAALGALAGAALVLLFNWDRFAGLLDRLLG